MKDAHHEEDAMEGTEAGLERRVPPRQPLGPSNVASLCSVRRQAVAASALHPVRLIGRNGPHDL